MKAKRPAQRMWQPEAEKPSGGELSKFIKAIPKETWDRYRQEAELGKRRGYRTASASRARAAQSPQVDTRIDRFAVYERDQGICHLCGGDVPRHDFHLDHVMPLSRGGFHVEENLKVAHPLCNLRKGAKLL